MTRITARPRAARTISAVLLTVALVALAGPASAHVTVSSTDATKGGYGKAVFRVPNESDTARTTKVVVTLPVSTPFAFVSAGVKPGWKIDVDTEKLDKPTKVGDFDLTEAVRTITWTASGQGIPVGQFDEFALSGGPFPDAGSISFTAEQTYSDGTTVAWDQEQTGDEEPEHPAPALTLAGSTAPVPAAAKVADDDDQLGTWLGGGALVVAAAALVVALRQNRRRA